MELNTSTGDLSITEGSSLKEIPPETENKSNNPSGKDTAEERNTNIPAPADKEDKPGYKEAEPLDKKKKSEYQERMQLYRESIRVPQEETRVPQEGTGVTQEETQLTQEEIQITQKETQFTQKETRFTQKETQFTQEEPRLTQDETHFTQEEPQFTQNETQFTQDEPGFTQDEPGFTQDEPEYKKRLRILIENKQSRKKIPKWKEQIPSGAGASRDKTPEKKEPNEKKELKLLLNTNPSAGNQRKINLSSTDELIALNSEVSFIFSDENTIKDHLINGKQGGSDLKRQTQQLRDTPQRLDFYRHLLDPFVTLSRRDYFLLFLRVQSELKFRRNELNSACKFLNVLLFTLMKNKFTFDEVTSCLSISRAQVKRIVTRMKELKWIGKDHSGNERYFYITETGLQLLKDAVEKKTSG